MIPGCLLLERRQERAHTFILSAGSLTIGSSLRADIVIDDDPRVAAMHARIDYDETTCALTDLGSEWGTFVNGRRLTPNLAYDLEDDDKITFGLTPYVGLLLGRPRLKFQAPQKPKITAPEVHLAGPQVVVALQVSRGSTVVAEHRIRRRQVRLGRAVSNDINLDDPAISGIHAELISTGLRPLIRDLGSAHGTTVDGVPINGAEAPLRQGSILILGPYRIVVTLEHTLAQASDEDTWLLCLLLAREPGHGTTLGRSIVPPALKPAPEPATIQKRRVDAAVPSEIQVDRPTFLLVQVRFQDSAPLGRAEWPSKLVPDRLEANSATLGVDFTDRASVPLWVQVFAPGVDINTQEYQIQVPRNDLSPVVTFMLTARKPGSVLISINVFTEQRWFLGGTAIDTRVSETASESAPLATAQLALTTRAVEAPINLDLEFVPKNSGWAAKMIVTNPDWESAVEFSAKAPIRFKQAALMETLDAHAYGAALTRQVFADTGLFSQWIRFLTIAEVENRALRFRLCLGESPALQQIRWETLQDPRTGSSLARHERVLLSRYLESTELPVTPQPQPGALHVLLAVANPSDVSTFERSPIDAAAEALAAEQAFEPAHIHMLGGKHGPATLKALRAAMKIGPAIVYLVCHGTLDDRAAYLCLENDAGQCQWVHGDEVVEAIVSGPRRPRLVVLASCRSAGDGYGNTLTALGPRLARAGVPAVIGFQGDIAGHTARRLLVPLFTELTSTEGEIDRALSNARRSLDDDWWQAVLWLRTRAGRLWARPN